MVVPIGLYIALPAFRDIPNLSVWDTRSIVRRYLAVIARQNSHKTVS